MTRFRTGMPSLSQIVKILLIINGIAYLAEVTMPQLNLTEWGGLHYWKSPLFKPHQVITHMFLHDPNSFLHILFNMLILWMFGSTLEGYWGAKRFLNFYLVCGIGAALVQMALIPWEVTREVRNIPDIPMDQMSAYIQDGINQYNMIGASGALMGIMAAFAYLFPNTEMFIYFIPIPIKVKYLIPVYILIDLFGGLNRSSGDNVGHFAHLGGALVGFLIVFFMNRTNQRDFY